MASIQCHHMRLRAESLHPRRNLQVAATRCVRAALRTLGMLAIVASATGQFPQAFAAHAQTCVQLQAWERAARSSDLTSGRLGRGAKLQIKRHASTTGSPTVVQRSRLVQAWGVIGVAMYLSYGVRKVVPIVKEGIRTIQNPWQWCLFAFTLGFFAYVEGYKGFQLGFSPRVVSRAWIVSEEFAQKNGLKTAKDLFKRYGSAYLLTSISLSLVSYTLFYELVKNGIDVAGALASVGITVQGSKYYGSAALAYALHKAASPIRFPPTVLLTQVVAKWMGKDTKQDDEDSEADYVPAPIWHKLLAPAFCIGYFHGTRKRVISSWAVTSVIFCVVVGVRRMANPYRAIIDAGVIVGLLWGTISVLLLFARSLKEGKPPDYDPCLPADTPYSH